MSNSLFFIQAEKNHTNSKFIDDVELFSDQNKQQVYMIDRPLADSKYMYDYKDALVLLAPDHKIIFVNFGADDDFEEYVEDFVEDLGSISDKFKYKRIIGRPRVWKDELIVQVNANEINSGVENFLSGLKIEGSGKKKQCELLISLLTGSINDIDKVKGDVPENVLDKIKQKILLFDGDQTRFVYQNLNKKRVTIQGLSGTGKTELLLHKLKDIYLENGDSKVIFTCHNKILADNLRSRIPVFFDFMKVEEQIKWNERLWCVNSWGSQSDKNSGAYSYICNFYGVNFLRYSYATKFDYVCKQALEEIRKGGVEKYGYAFDFMLVDESQDFPKEFFDLCELVTKNTVYVAGDIFQGIFDNEIISEINPDFLLSKCYRTDPKTLMFAHALGMGLFENPKLRWLEDREWKACGYLVNRDQPDIYSLSREPLRRFEDLEHENYSSIELVKTSKELSEDAEVKVLEIIKVIRSENPTVLADDIGVIFIDSTKNTYNTADKLEQSIPREFDWEVNKAYETKRKIPDTLFVSNKNNVKGLEFPFVICVTKKVNDARNYRNALYMMLTRSFLKSYLLISLDSNVELCGTLEVGLEVLKNNGSLDVSIPSDEEKEFIRTTITYDDEQVSFYDFVYAIFDELDVLAIFRPSLFGVVKNIAGENFDEEEVRNIVEFNYSKMVDREK